MPYWNSNRANTITRRRLTRVVTRRGVFGRSAVFRRFFLRMDDANTTQSSSTASTKRKGKQCAAFGCSNAFYGSDGSQTFSFLPLQNEVDKPTQLLQFVAFVHLPFSFRSVDLFVASLLFMKGTLFCLIRKK